MIRPNKVAVYPAQPNNIASGLGLLFSVAGIYLFQKSAIIWVLGGILGHILGAIRIAACAQLTIFFPKTPGSNRFLKPNEGEVLCEMRVYLIPSA